MRKLPASRQEILTRLNKIIAAEKISQPLNLIAGQQIESEDVSAEDSADTLAQIQQPGPLGTPSSASL